VRVPLEWLKEFVVFDLGPEELARKLTMRGLEVEAVEEIRPAFTGVVVGRILDIEKHPDASHLSLCQVDGGGDPVPVVCGASNIHKGDYVPLAIPGAVVSDVGISKQKIRGVESYGMLCSERELGLSDDHSGIFILPSGLNPGDGLDRALGVNDVVFDINVSPNRGDLLSILGMAREVASATGSEVKLPPVLFQREAEGNIGGFLKLKVQDQTACPRYVLRMIRNLSITPSPFWMRQRIIKSGMRPINLIVDVTNYVMLELGQPLHAFDSDTLRGGMIEVRLAGDDNLFRTLDGADRAMEAADLLICDATGPVAIAGIMGGENSEITETTTNVALESAFFNPLFVRRCARRLGIKSEASLRFEKGIDIENVEFASRRALALIENYSGGTVVGGKEEFFVEPERTRVSVRFAGISDFLGIAIERDVVTEGLRSLGFGIEKEDDSGLETVVPLFRHDIVEKADIIEEVARTFGYDYIPATMPCIGLQAQKEDRKETLLTRVKDAFRASGFMEAINFAFFTVKDIENFHFAPADIRNSHVSILNPISREYEVMRTFISANLLKNVAYNLNRGERNLRLFEYGKVFFETTGGMPLEKQAIAFFLTGQEREFFWRDQMKEYDFFDAKGVVDTAFSVIGLSAVWEESTEPFLVKGRAADIYVDGSKIGWVGELSPDILNLYGIDQKVLGGDFFFDPLVQKGILDVKYRQISRYPAVVRDFAFFIEDSIRVSDVMSRIYEISPLIVSVDVFDMFKKDRRSVAFRVVFQSFEETLKEEQITGIQDMIITELTRTDGITLRT